MWISRFFNDRSAESPNKGDNTGADGQSPGAAKGRTWFARWKDVGGSDASVVLIGREDGSYAIQRPFVLVTKTAAPLSEAAQAFFDFATSADAAPLIAQAGAVAVN